MHPLLPVPKIRRRHRVDLRSVIDAIRYQQASECLWRSLPKRFAAWGTVYMHYANWRQQGLWQQLCEVMQTANESG